MALLQSPPSTQKQIYGSSGKWGELKVWTDQAMLRFWNQYIKQTKAIADGKQQQNHQVPRALSLPVLKKKMRHLLLFLMNPLKNVKCDYYLQYIVTETQQIDRIKLLWKKTFSNIYILTCNLFLKMQINKR